MSTLKKIFGQSSAEIWRQLTAEIDGQFIPSSYWKREQVLARHGEWTITLDTYFSAGTKTMYTRIRAPYVNPDGFRFSIYRRGLFSDIAKWMGMQDVKVGHSDFDRDFIIKGTDEAKLRRLFDNARLRSLIAAQPEIYLTVQSPTEGATANEDVDELTFALPGVIENVERLKQLFELFGQALDQLCLIGSAYESPAAAKQPSS